jgi:Ca2+/H+ antiporter, TMEM165/GDT1 family
MFAAAPIVLAAFLASFVEGVEAFTIVLAVSVVRGVRPAVLGTLAAFALLALAVILLGPLIARIPIHSLQTVIGLLLLVFGLGWLRKAVLRAGGALALHDETAAFAEESEALKSAAEWIAGMAAFKAVLLEGIEVVFIILAIAPRPGMLLPASIGAAAAWVLVLAVGLLARAPLARVPENSLKFVVGALLSGFGVFWLAEGLAAPFPGGDLAIPVLIAVFLGVGVAKAGFVRFMLGGRAAWT